MGAGQLDINTVNAVGSLKVAGVEIVNSTLDATFHSLKIGSTTVIDASDNALFTSVNAGSYSVGGTPGVDASGGSEVTSVSSATIQYKDWSGTNQSATFVSVVNTASTVFIKGIRTT
jgi:hypothetical protein